MRISLRSTLGGVTALAIAGGLAAVGAGSAYAAGPTSPLVPYSPDPQSQGAIHLFDAAGNAVTGGSLTDTPFAAYAVADGAGSHAGDTKATLYIYTPVEGQQPNQWLGNNQLSGSTTYPVAGAPSSIAGANATSVITPDDTRLQDHVDDKPNVSTTYAGLYELRMITSFPSPAQFNMYYSADIKVTGTTWTLVNPVTVAASTTTTVTATPASGATTATAVTLSATVSPAAAGSVQFKDGGVNIGTAQAIAAGGTASVTNTFASAGAKTITADFTPTNAASFAASTGTLSYTVAGAPATSTTTALSANPQTGAPAGTPVTLTATVTPASAVGSVQFFEDASLLGSTPVATGSAVFTTSNFLQGTHNITAKFVPTNAGSFVTSTSPLVVVTTAAGTGPAPDPQTVVVTVKAGTLVINTPYTPTSPLILPDMVLNANGTLLSTSAQFGTIATPIQITDTRAGNLPWIASALASPFANAGATAFINPQNLGLTDLQYVTVAGNALNPGNVSIYDNIAANGVTVADAGVLGLGGSTPHKFADAAHGNGTIGFTGTMTLNAPTSTVAGTYTSTVTFTIG